MLFRSHSQQNFHQLVQALRNVYRDIGRPPTDGKDNKDSLSNTASTRGGRGTGRGRGNAQAAGAGRGAARSEIRDLGGRTPAVANMLQGLNRCFTCLEVGHRHYYNNPPAPCKGQPLRRLNDIPELRPLIATLPPHPAAAANAAAPVYKVPA